MEMEVEAAEGRGRKERTAVGHAEMEVEIEVDAGAEVAEAIDEWEVGGEGSQAEEEDATDGIDDAREREEGGAFDRKVAKKQKKTRPCTRVSAGSRGSWKGRSGRGRRGFHHRPWYGAKNLRSHKLDILNRPGVYGGAIILCNHVTKLESFRQRLFALPEYATSFIRKIRAGMLLFVFEREERKLCGLFEATSDGALNILPSAFPSRRKSKRAQVRFRRVWFCKPLTEAEFSDAIKGLEPHMSFLGISYQQVLNLVHLFSSKRISLELYQKPKSRVIWDYNVSLARAGLESNLHTHSNTFPSRSSSMLCNNRASLPDSSFMYSKQNAKHPHLKPVMFKAPDIIEKGLEPNADFIPLDLDDCKSDSNTVLSDILGPVSFDSALAGRVSYEDQDPEPLIGKHNDDDGYLSPVLNQSLISLSETSQNSAIAHFMKERQSSMQGRGCKRRAILWFDEHSELSSPRSCTVAKKVSFNSGGDEISLISDKQLHRPALAELEQNREAVTKERKQEGCYSVQDTEGRSGDDSEKRSKLMRLYPSQKGLLNNMSRAAPGVVSHGRSSKLTCTLLPDEEQRDSQKQGF